MTSVSIVAFWVLTALILYTLVGYPLLLFAVARWWRQPVSRACGHPSVTVLIAAHNEVEHIATTLDHLLASDYPRERLQVLVAADGCDDGTQAVVERYADRGVWLLDRPRRGKILALHEAIELAQGQILIFADANTHYHPQALARLVRGYADPRVGGVCGQLRDGPGQAAQGESIFRLYDQWLKGLESELDSCVSAHGGIYSIRRALYRLPDSLSVTDDFMISTEVVARGYRLIYEPSAIACEEVAVDVGNEFRRKVRIISTGLRALWLRRGLLNPLRHPRYALVLWSHKLMRRLLPPMMLALLALSLYLVSSGPAYAMVAIGGLATLALGGAGLLLERYSVGRYRPLAMSLYFCMGNLATVVAWMRFLMGHEQTNWERSR